MTSTIPFLQLYDLGAEITSGCPFVIRECTRKSDHTKLIVKVYCKLGQTTEDLLKFRAEVEFWRLIKHNAVTMSTDTYDEEGFAYLLYPFPSGGNLATLVNDPSRSFTEGFARYIATILLDATSFLHSNGIIHGAILPYNIVFSSDTTVPGWVHSAKLALYVTQASTTATAFTDLQDIAYTTCSILRQKSGMFPRNIFHPKYLGAVWQHLSPACLSFITDLWNAERDGRNIDYFRSHVWIRGGSSSTSSSSSSSSSASYATSKHMDGYQDPRAALDSYFPTAPVALKRYIYYKMRERSKVGTHKWIRALGTLESHFLVIDNMLERDVKNADQDQILPHVIDLTGRTAVVAAGSRHDFTLGVLDIEQQRIVIWLRFDNNEDYLVWKQTIMDLSDPSRETPASASTNTNSAIANASSSSNTATTNTEQASSSSMIAAIKGVATSNRGTSRVNGQSDPFWYHQAIVEAANLSSQLYLRQINAQSAAYLRDSKTTIGWRWTAGDKSKGYVSGWRLIDPTGPTSTTTSTTSGEDCVSLAPLPSNDRAQVHSAVKWSNRASELSAVVACGVPMNTPVSEGQQWFIVDATWFRHWVAFVTSTRRMAPPGPIDNSWMLDPSTSSSSSSSSTSNRPYLHLVEETDEARGDYRRVPPQVWSMFSQWYGGGPDISALGPPVSDTRRWVIHDLHTNTSSSTSSSSDKPSTGAATSTSTTTATNMMDLVSRLEDPSAVERRRGGAAVAVNTKGRRASAAEVAFVAAASGFGDAEASSSSATSSSNKKANIISGNSGSASGSSSFTGSNPMVAASTSTSSTASTSKSTLASLFGSSAGTPAIAPTSTSTTTASSTATSTSGNKSKVVSPRSKLGAIKSASSSNSSDSEEEEEEEGGGQDDFEPVIFIRDSEGPITTSTTTINNTGTTSAIRRSSEPNATSTAKSAFPSTSNGSGNSGGNGTTTSTSNTNTTTRGGDLSPSKRSNNNINTNNVFFINPSKSNSTAATATSTTSAATIAAIATSSTTGATSTGISTSTSKEMAFTGSATTATTAAPASASGGSTSTTATTNTAVSATTTTTAAVSKASSNTTDDITIAEPSSTSRSKQQRKSTGSFMTGVTFEADTSANTSGNITATTAGNNTTSTSSNRAVSTTAPTTSTTNARRSSLFGTYFNKGK